jgi:hypothetical protein
VRFVTSDCYVQTREGAVHARTGDAILTGTKGEHWRVPRSQFDEKYHPVAPTEAGQGGRYVALPIRVAAVQMHEPFEVVTAAATGRSIS